MRKRRGKRKWRVTLINTIIITIIMIVWTERSVCTRKLHTCSCVNHVGRADTSALCNLRGHTHILSEAHT